MGYNILFVTFDDLVYALGTNSEGQLGLGHNTPIHTPQEVPELHNNFSTERTLYWLSIQITMRYSALVEIRGDNWDGMWILTCLITNLILFHIFMQMI